jgi:hypothetical protein
MLGDRALFNAVRQLDIKCVKLDAGHTWMNRPREDDSLKTLLSVWTEIPNLTLQSFFSEGRFNNTLSQWVDPWIEQVKLIKPRRVQLYTLDRSPAVGVMQKASLSTLSRIARRLALAVETEVHARLPWVETHD